MKNVSDGKKKDESQWWMCDVELIELWFYFEIHMKFNLKCNVNYMLVTNEMILLGRLYVSWSSNLNEIQVKWTYAVMKLKKVPVK